MRKVFITESAIREYLREAMDSSSINDVPLTPEVNINPVIASDAAEVDPSNQNFVPANRAELMSALRIIANSTDDEDAPEVYVTIKHALDVHEEEMKNKKVEESIRMIVRKILNEESKEEKAKKLWAGLKEPVGPLPPVKKIPAGEHGAEYLNKLEKRKTGLNKQFSTMRDDEDSKDMEHDDAPASGRSRKNVMMGDVSGASFKEIAKEMGFAAESGAKQAVEKALEKAKFTGAMDPDELEILTLSSMNDYIKMLASSGDLDAEEVQVLKNNPGIVRELDGFRDFLDKSIRKARKGSKLENPLGED